MPMVCMGQSLCFVCDWPLFPSLGSLRESVGTWVGQPIGMECGDLQQTSAIGRGYQCTGSIFWTLDQRSSWAGGLGGRSSSIVLRVLRERDRASRSMCVVVGLSCLCLLGYPCHLRLISSSSCSLCSASMGVRPVPAVHVDSEHWFGWNKQLAACAHVRASHCEQREGSRQRRWTSPGPCR